MLTRILVVKWADIGDVLTATPAMRALRETYPEAQIDLLTTPGAAPAVPRHLVDGIRAAERGLVRVPADIRVAGHLFVDLRRAHYDVVFFLHHLTLRAGAAKYRLLATATGAPMLVGCDNGLGAWLTHALPDQGFGALHEVDYWLQVVALAGARTTDLRLAVQFDHEDLRVADRLLAGWRGFRVVIHPGSGGYSLARRWEPDKWASLADSLIDQEGAQVILVGARSDGVHAVETAMGRPVLNLAAKTTLPQLAALISRSQLFVGADSGIMHMASAVGVPVVALFGPSNERAWRPWTPGGSSIVVRLHPACSPCSYVGHQVGQRDGCWHRSCMADLTADRVMAAIMALDLPLLSRSQA